VVTEVVTEVVFMDHHFNTKAPLFNTNMGLSSCII